MTNNNLFCDEQHRFIKDKPCVAQILEFMEGVTAAIDQGYEVDVINLDLYTAFDKDPPQEALG